MIPSVEEIAKRLNGPYERWNHTDEYMSQLREIRWGWLSKQEKAEMLMFAREARKIIEECLLNTNTKSS